MAKDFRNKTFGRILRGYNPEEVDEYIAYISDEYRKLERRCADSERKLALALKKLDELNRKFMGEDTADKELAAAAISEARDEADRIISDANAQAAEIVEHAEMEAAAKARLILEEAAKGAEEILAGAEKDAAESKKTADSLFATAGKMYGEVCAFRDSLFEIYNSHIESIERMTEEAEHAMGAVEDTYAPAEEAAVPVLPVDEPDETTEEPEIEVEFYEAEEPAPEDEIPTDDTDIPADLIIDPADELDEPDPDLLEDVTGEPDEPVFDPEEAEALPDGMIDAYDEDEYDDIPFETEESADFDAEDYSDGDPAIYDEIDSVADDDDGFRIDWSRRAVEEDEDGFDEEDDAPAEEENEAPEEQSAFANLDELFSKEGDADELSLTDEFNRVFNSSNAKKNVEQIRRQPTVAPEKPKNPKKHQKF